jgi:hypothetical protein
VSDTAPGIADKPVAEPKYHASCRDRVLQPAGKLRIGDGSNFDRVRMKNAAINEWRNAKTISLA